MVKQIKHLPTYPFIRQSYQKGRIRILVWHYIIEIGEIFQYDKESKSFCLIEEGEEG